MARIMPKLVEYDRPFANDDLIDLSTLSITRNCGRLMRNPPIEMGKANLKSTKHKEELSLKQMQRHNAENPNVSMAIASLFSPLVWFPQIQRHNAENPNVSMAIARKCATILETSKQLEEEDVSDAETLGSDCSDDSEEDDDKDDNDDCSNDENDDDNDCSNGENRHEDDVIDQFDRISEGEDKDSDEVDNEVKGKLGFPVEECKGEQIKKNGRSRRDRINKSDLEDEDNLSTVVVSKDFEEDFDELTRNISRRQNTQVSPDRNNVDFENQRPRAISSPRKSSSFKSMSNTNQRSVLRVVGMNQSREKKSGVANNADTSFTSSMGNLSVVDKAKSKDKECNVKPSTGANITSATFNLSATGNPMVRLLDISSIRGNDSFCTPAEDNLSFVSISSPGKIKPRSPVKRQQKHLGDTYLIDEFITDTRKPPHSTGQKTSMDSKEVKLDHSFCNHNKRCTEINTGGLKVDTTSSPASLRDHHKPVASGLSGSSCPIPAPDEAFKSPHGIKVRRIRPRPLSSNVSEKSQDISTNLSGKVDVQQPTSPVQNLKASLFTTKSWEKCESIISSISTLSRGNDVQSASQFGDVDTENLSEFGADQNKMKETYQPKRLETNVCKDRNNRVPCEVSFTSTEESEKPWSKACELALKSPTKRNDHSNNCFSQEKQSKGIWKSPSQQKDHLNSYNQITQKSRLDTQTNFDIPSSPQSNKLNISLTSSFKNMDLYPNQTTKRNYQLAVGNSLRPSKDVASQNKCYTVEERVKTFESLRANATFTQLTPSLPTTLTSGPTGLPTRTGKYYENRLTAAGFDQLKWKCKEKLHPRTQDASALKRKIPASFTSGYCSQTSPPQQESDQNIKLFPMRSAFEKNYEKLTNHSVPSKYCQQNNRTGFDSCSSCLTTRQSGPVPWSDFVFGSNASSRKSADFKDFVQNHAFRPYKSSSYVDVKSCPVTRESAASKQPKCRPKEPPGLVSETGSVNPFLLSPRQEVVTPQANTPQAFSNMDNSHVLRWLEASRKHYDPVSPLRSFQNKPTIATITNRSQKVQTDTPDSSSTAAQVSPGVRCYGKKDVGIQVSLEASYLQSVPQHCPSPKTHCLCCSTRNVSCWPSVYDTGSSFKKPAFYQRIDSQHHMCTKSTTQGSTQSRFSETPSPLTQKSLSVGQGSLNTRAMAVWREIQAEKSVEQTFPSDFSVIESDTTPFASTGLNDEQLIGEYNNEPEFADDEEVVKETSVELEPRRHSTLLDDLNKMFGGNLENRSFVEAQNARSRSHVKSKKHSSNNLADAATGQQGSKNIMFPMSYIHQFSPTNPARRDSDMAMYQYEQQLLASAPTYKSMLRSFKPRRNQHQAQTPKTSHAQVVPVSQTEDVIVERPLKFRKVTKTSPSMTKLKSPEPVIHETSNQRPYHSARERIDKASVLPNKPQKFSLPAASAGRKERLSLTKATKVSTPVKKSLPMSDLGLELDETISTIISETEAVENLSCSMLDRTPMPQDSILSLNCSDSDSESEIDLV
ncbi:hypothetical protein ElyMa_006689400 [Elysia marginata]|uniref:Uncharacterized protein n=1 Tax=Elysia marginata TaxID=1093978 RepID=A0AAV4IS98_9GAST|nr:hypothetical protein ElyMa_006689400 [Elysia marginata]